MSIKTTCPYCGVGCGVIAKSSKNGSLTITGDPDHPANMGRLCTKGMMLGDTIGLDGRLNAPMFRQANGDFIEIKWDEAYDKISSGLKDIINKFGPSSVAVYLSGQLLTEDYYVANKFMKGFIGSSNLDTNSRLCMASTVAGYRRAFGSDTVPACYEDIDQADLIVIVGSNTAWCHPILFQRILDRRIKGAKVVVVDTRRTITADSADLYLEISPGTDQALFCGLLAYLAEFDASDNTFILKHTTGYEEALRAARNIAPTVDASAAATGVDVSKIGKFYKLFCSTERVITIFSQGVNQSSQGVDKVNSIINCHLATGRIGKPGASPFSFTGQPNAMGGREVGGLANMLAAHMGYDPESIERVRRFWDAPNIADKEGLKAIQMFEAISRGEIKALWVCGTNPAASLPDADRYRQSFSDLELFVVSDNVIANDTINSGAQIILPALAWGEKNGTVTNSERRISRQRAFLVPPQEARADWEIFARVASRMGFSGFDYRSALDVFREHAELSTFENEGRRDFDIGGLSELTDYDYENLQPVQWPVRRESQQGQARVFEDGIFFTSDQRARFIAIKEPRLASNLTEQFPLYLNTGRVRDQWHTMTRTGLSEKLARDNPEPFIEISPEDAAKNNLKNGGFSLVKTVHGQCILRIKVTDRQAANSIFAPIHWTNEHSSNARVGSLVSPAIDPISGQPELKATPVAVSPVLYKWEGYLLSHKLLLFPKDLWWTKVAVNGIQAYHLAGDMNVEELVDLLKNQIDDCQISNVVNFAGNIFYEKYLKDKKCRFLFFIGDCVDKWDLLINLYREASMSENDLLSFLEKTQTADNTSSSNFAQSKDSFWQVKRTDRQMTNILSDLKKIPILRDVSDDLLSEFIGRAEELDLKPGEVLFNEGQIGDSVYVIMQGLVQIYVTNPSDEEVVLGALSEGDLLGEHYLFRDFDRQRGASARAKKLTKVLRIDGEAFMNLMIHDPRLAKIIQVRRDQRENENLIKLSEFYKVLSNLEAVDPQKTISFNVGDIIFREGDEPDAAWLIINGQVSVYHEANSNDPIATLGPGQCFGERACLDKTKRNATVKALTHLVAIKISRDHFIQLYEISDELKSIISGLEFLYHLNQRGLALQYFSRKTGQISIERVYRLNNGERYLSSWTPSHKVFRLDRLDVSKSSGNYIEAQWSEPVSANSYHKRMIGVLDKKIHNLSVIGEWPELSNLIEATIEGCIVEERDLRTFEKSGRLDIQLPEKDEEQVCFCLGITASAIRSHIRSGCDTFEEMREKTGCGSVCGGCEPQIQSMLGRSEWIPIVAESFELADGVRNFILKPTLDSALEWKTGQYLVFSGRIGQHWINRSYTIVSPPSAGSPLEVAIKREPKGLFSNWLFEGDLSDKELRISSPRGDSIWKASELPTVCFVAGIGITPAIAILRAREYLKSKGYLHIDYSGREAASMAYIAELNEACTRDDRIKIIYRYTSQGSRITKKEIRDTITAYTNANYYLCGPESYLDAVISALKEAGVPEERIFEERFSHAGGPITIQMQHESAEQIIGPDALQYKAQELAILDGKALTPEEQVKREKHPLDRWDEIVERARLAQFPTGTDIFVTKYFGLFYVAPAQDSFMCRLRIPNGILTGWQVRELAQLSSSLGGGYVDVTTRANLQIRNIKASSAQNMLIAIESLGLTTRGSGADNIRNITGSPTAGIDPYELIDTRPLCLEMHHYILNHRELYGLPRKFNIAFNGGGTVSVLEETNDIGFSAVKVFGDPVLTPGVYFRLLLGGATGHGDFAFDSDVLVRPDDCVQLAGAILRVFIRLGDRTNRQKARLKFLIQKMGRDGFLKEVEDEWGHPLLRTSGVNFETPVRADNHGHIGVYPQKQPGMHYIGVQTSVGRVSSDQLAGIANVCEKFGSGTVRLTVWQNLIISDVSDEKLDACLKAIKDLGLGVEASAFKRGLVACTGNAGCKFAAANTKAHAIKIADHLEARFDIKTPINIHLTGCRNSCAQHYIGDIGLVGVKVDVAGVFEEGYNIFIGGGPGEKGKIAKEYASFVTIRELLPIIEDLIACWIKNRANEQETFHSFANRYDTESLKTLARE